jgi:hypothetical protein
MQKIGVLTVLNSRLNFLERPFNDRGDRFHKGSFIDTTKAFRQMSFYKIDTASGSVGWLNRILDLAGSHGVKVFAYTSPYYYNLDEGPGEQALFNQQLSSLVFEKRSIPYADFAYFYKPAQAHYFYDEKHLNEEGANRFTPLLAGRFRELSVSATDSILNKER